MVGVKKAVARKLGSFVRGIRMGDARFLATVACGGLCIALLIWLAGAHKPWDVLAKDPGLEKLTGIIRFFSWWAAASNALLLAVLAATAFWWAGSRSAGEAWLPGVVRGRWFWPLISLAALVVLVQGYARLGQSLWDDEDASVRTYIHGEWERSGDGTLTFDKPEWKHAFFNNRRATNHQLQTIVSRIFHEGWVAFARPSGLGLSEAAIRLPVLLAGALSIFTLAGLLSKLGLARAAVVAAFLLAVHPWHLRYAAEARGYMFAMAFLPLFVWMLIRALDRRSWGAWACAAASGFLLLYSHTSMLYTVALGNGLALLAVFLRNGPGNRLDQVVRFVVVNMFAGMLYLQLMLPCAPQLAAFLASETMTAPLTPRWHANLAAHFFSGIPWNNSDSALSGALELKWLAEARPMIHAIAMWGALALACTGLLRIAFKRPIGWLAAMAFVIPAAAVYLMARARGTYMYEWYLIPALPGIAACVAAGIEWISRIARPLGRPVPVIILAGLVAGFAAITNPARQRLLSGSIEPMRESVLSIRPVLDPTDPRQKSILTGKLNAPPRAYDPNAISVHTIEILQATMRKADARGVPFYVNYGNLHAAAVDFPGVFAILENDAFFEKLPVMHGLDPTLDRHIRKYRPGSAAGLYQQSAP